MKNPRTPAEPISRSRRTLLAAAALCLLVLAAYSNSFTAGFTLDNRGLLLDDPRIHAATAENLTNIFSHTYWWPYGESGLYRPFTTITYLFNYAILGNAAQPFGYHLLNLLLHAANVLLAFALARRLLQSFWPPLAIAAVWAVHPVLTESVTNIIGRADLLAALAILAGLLLYRKSDEADGPRRWLFLAALAAAATLGAYSKEIAVVLPVAILLLWRTQASRRAVWPPLLASAVPVLVVLLHRASVLAAAGPTEIPANDNPLVLLPAFAAKLTALKVMAHYLALLAWPVHLSSDYSYAQITPATGTLADILCWLPVIAVAAGIVLLYRRHRPLFFLCAVAVVVFLPTSNLFIPIGTIMAERFLYLPALALSACVVVAVFAAAARLGKPRFALAVLALIAVFTARTWLRNQDWQDDLTLATATADQSSGSFKSHKLLAAALYAADPSHANIDRVIAEADKSLTILNGLPDAWNNPESFVRTAGYYVDRGDRANDGGASYRHAIDLFERALTVVQANDERANRTGDPRIGDIHRSISAVRLRLKDSSGALAEAQRALTAAPLAPGTYEELAAALVTSGHPDEAAIVLMQGVLLTADEHLRENLVSLYRQGLGENSCALLLGSSALNRECALVHRHLCTASEAAIRTRQDTGRPDLAEVLRASAKRDFNCKQ